MCDSCFAGVDSSIDSTSSSSIDGRNADKSSFQSNFKSLPRALVVLGSSLVFNRLIADSVSSSPAIEPF
jgi:hypothetical protein